MMVVSSTSGVKDDWGFSTGGVDLRFDPPERFLPVDFLAGSLAICAASSWAISRSAAARARLQKVNPR
jgi:hypothetical protein